jgi:hypothetical protein
MQKEMTVYLEKSPVQISLNKLPYRINLQVQVQVTLRLTVSQSVSLGIKHPPGAHDQMFIAPRLLRSCFCWAPSLTRGWVCLFICCWPLPAQCFSGPSPLGLATINLFPCLKHLGTDNVENTVHQLLRLCMLRALSNNGRCLQSSRLAAGLYATTFTAMRTPNLASPYVPACSFFFISLPYDVMLNILI